MPTEAGGAPLVHSTVQRLPGRELLSKGEQDQLNAELVSEAEAGRSDAVAVLLQRGAYIHFKDKERGGMALHLAASKGHRDTVRVLLEHGARINAVTESGETALHVAAAHGDSDTVRFLLERGAEVGVKHESVGYQALHFAAFAGDPDTIHLLLKGGAQIDATEWTNRSTALHVAAKLGHANAIRVLLDHGADIHACDKEDANTALHIAAIEGHSNSVRLLLERGANVHEWSIYRRTALHMAATKTKGNAESIRTLLEYGADIHAKEKEYGYTVLIIAAASGHSNGVRELLERGALIGEKDRRGSAALHWAARNGFSDVVRVLFQYGADIHSKGESGYMALHFAAEEGRLDCVRVLLDHGADVNAHGEQYGRTALHLSAGKGHVETVRLLLENGAAINAKDTTFEETALHSAINKGHSKPAADADHAATIRLLLAHGAAVGEKNKFGDTVLHVAARQGLPGCVRVLLKHGADVHAENRDGQTALHLCARYKRADLVQLLLQHGAGIDAKDKEGQTPLTIAIHVTKSDQDLYNTAKTLCDAGASWDESHEKEKTDAAGVRACVSHWTRQRARNPSVRLTDVPMENVKAGRNSVETYLNAMAATTAEEIVRRRKLCVIGASCSGKTSFVRSLQALKTVMVDELDRTIGIDLFGLNLSETNERSKYEATIWDFAGQDVYQVAHSLYFSKRTLYLVFVNVELYNEQLLHVDGRQADTRLSRWVRDNIFCWVQLVLGRQPDAELVLVCSKCDTVKASAVDTVIADLEHRFHSWSTEFASEHDSHGPVLQELQRTLREVTDRERLRVSVASEFAVKTALENVQRVVKEKPERAYLMPRLYTQVLDAICDIREASAAATSVASRVEMLLVDSDSLVRGLMDKIDGLTRRQCRDILGTLHALGDILWFEQERHLSYAGSSTLVLDPRLMLDLVREVVNHELQGRQGLQYDLLRAHGELRHSLLSTFPFWRALCEQSPRRVLYFKRLLKHFNLAYPVGKQAILWDSDLIVPSYWKTTKQPAGTVGGVTTGSCSSEAVWQYTVPSNVSKTIFDQFIVQSHDVDYELSVTSTSVLMSKPQLCNASIVYSEGKKPSQDVIIIRAMASSTDECWHTVEYLVVSMERVLEGYPGLSPIGRHVLQQSGKAAAVERWIKTKHCAATEKLKVMFQPSSTGA